MRLIFTLAFLFTVSLCFAQRQNVYFLKDNGEYIKNRDSADFIRVVREPDSSSTLYNVFEFYPNGSNKLTGKSSVIDPPKFEGTCIRFYANGKKQLVSNYKNGIVTGSAYEYYPNGKLYQVKQFPENGIVYGDVIDNYLITAEYDSLGTPLVTDGNGYYKSFDNKFKTVVEEGNLKNGKKDGQWKGREYGLHITYVETYANSVLISGSSYGEKSGDSVTYKSRAVEPSFKGGVAAFSRYLSNNIQYPDYEKSHNIQGKVILSFVVERDGTVTDIKVLNPVSENIDNEAIRVIKESRKWIPGIEFGRNVRVQYSIPISFALNN